MPKVHFIEHDGTPHEVEGTADQSLMLAALDNLVPGIDADCGGDCACATCHVILTPEWYEKSGGPNPLEAEMLDMNPERTPTSRLSCQIKLSDELDGITANLPEFQF